MMARVLLCDDELMNRKVASKILTKEGHEVVEAVNGKEAIELLDSQSFDLILMDLMMPVMDGFEATRIIKSTPRVQNIPLIVISALSERQNITKALELGANEYLTKPFDIVEFRLRINNAIALGSYQNMLQREVDKKTQELQKMLQEVEKSEKDILQILSKVAEFRDNETSTHTLRVGKMAAVVAESMGWSKEDVELILWAAPMHDIGKVGIEDAILLKPGKLTNEEFEKMKEHATIGYQILSQKETPLLQMAAKIALTHHEKWDGSGYPNALKAEAIDLCGAITAVVDVFDALISRRPYKEPFSPQKAQSIIKEGSGSHFHPEVVKHFFQNIDAIMAIQKEMQDSANL